MFTPQQSAYIAALGAVVLISVIVMTLAAQRRSAPGAAGATGLDGGGVYLGAGLCAGTG